MNFCFAIIKNFETLKRVILNHEDHIRPSKRTQKQIIGQNNTEEF